MKIAEITENKRILIWGFGMEGRCVEAFLRTHCRVKELAVYEGKQDGIREELYDMIIKSPGIREQWYGEKYTSMTELFLREFSAQTIGITGTKGKSTTSSLLYECLKACGKDVLLAGNIGIPCLELYDRIGADTIIVFELSCHQLDHIRVAPHVAVFLNLFEEHLDHYDTFERYFAAKANITLKQKPGDLFFAGGNVPELETAAEKHVLAADSPLGFELKLKGEHNRFNARVVHEICTGVFGCGEKEVRAAMAAFGGLRHRMEYLGNADGIDFYDDSISTIPAATIAALKSIPNAKTVLIGGMDRHIDYSMLLDFIPEHPEYEYIFMYGSGERVYGELRGHAHCHYREDLRGAVALAKEITGKGEACLLSPAAASYGYFKNFEERGDVFRRLAGLEEKKETVLAFTGDIGFDHYMARKWEDEELLSEGILSFLGGADHVIANVEGPLMGADAQLVSAAEMRLMHTIDPAATTLLRKIRADIWNLCNNHIMDAGEEGLARTLKEAADFGALTLGVGKNLKEAMRPVILDEAGGIGIFSAGYRRGCKPAGEDKGGCLCWNEMEKIGTIIRDIKAKCRWCVAVIHGGEEFTSLPSPYTRERYLRYLELGADLVVCHHPHVPMNYERVGEKAIFYSLGNFIFDTPYQRAQYHTEEGVLLKIRFSHEKWDFEAQGLLTDRVSERVTDAKLPAIFTEVPEAEYEKLAPLSARAFVSATKRQQIFLHPERFANASEAEWKEHFADPKRSGRVDGEALDFLLICPLSEQADQGAWKESGLSNVKEYILEQIGEGEKA